MTTTRRRFLKLTAGGIILAAGAGGTFVATRRPDQALKPWQQAGGYPEDYRKQALSYALLAPNPHNRQPWMADLSGTDQIAIYRDPALNLPETDPFDRQLTIGMGCFLELLRIAASQSGHSTDFDLFPQGEEGPVAIVRFSPGAQADPAFAYVLERRTNREPYSERPPETEAVRALSAHASILTEPQQVASLRELTWKAWEVESTTPRTHRESVDLFRIGKSEINANPDGIYLGGPLLEILAFGGMLSRKKMLDPSSAVFRQTLEIFRKALFATPAYAVITSPGNTRRHQIEAGARWLRFNLAATANGLSTQPVSQALQEYREMTEHYATAHAMLAKPGETVQMLGRLGYGPAVAPAPRWPLEDRIG